MPMMKKLRDYFEQKISVINLLLLLSVALMHGLLFLTGYRLTADDVQGHYVLMSGQVAQWEFIKTIAISQGRFVHFFAGPLGLIGSFIAENLFFRFLYTLLYFFIFFLVGHYVAKLTKINIAYLIFLVLVCFNPLDYQHLPPNSFPLHTTVSIFLILMSRIGLWHIREKKSFHFFGEFFCLLFCFLGTIVSEFAFVFLCLLVFIELVVRSTYQRDDDWYQSTRYWLKHPYFIKDYLLIALFMACYVIFRLIYPSSYGGNKIGDGFHFLLFLKTILGHILGGTSFVFLIRKESFIKILTKMSFSEISLTITLFIATYFSTWMIIRKIYLENFRQNKINLNWFPIVLIGLLFSIGISAPTSATTKYQGWCAELGLCSYIDSRLSFLGIGVIISIVLSFLVIKKGKLILLSFILAVFSSYTYVNNSFVEKDMSHFVSGWERATKLSCVTNKSQLVQDPLFLRIIDPYHRISYHPGFDIKGYWLKYINLKANETDCSSNVFDLIDFSPVARAGLKVDHEKLLYYLLQGWSGHEPFGVWSDGNLAEVYLKADGNLKSINLELVGYVNSLHPRQQIVIKINDTVILSKSITNSNPYTFEIPVLAENLGKDNVLRIRLILPDAISPYELGLSDDKRKLGVSLLAISVL